MGEQGEVRKPRQQGDILPSSRAGGFGLGIDRIHSLYYIPRPYGGDENFTHPA